MSQGELNKAAWQLLDELALWFEKDLLDLDSTTFYTQKNGFVRKVNALLIQYETEDTK